MKTWTELINPGGAIHEFIMSGTPEQKKQAIESLAPIAMFIDTYNAVTPDVKKKIDDLLLGRTVKPAAGKNTKPSVVKRPKRTDAVARILSLKTSNSALPILEYVYITKDGRISNSDLEITIGTKLPNWSASEDVLVPFKLLKGLKEGDLLGCEKGNLKTTAGDFKFEAPFTYEYPKIPDIENSYTFEMKEAVIEQIRLMKIFCGHDELRPVMHGVCFKPNSIAATDAHKLRWIEMKTGLPEKFEDGVIIPNSVFKYLIEGKCTVSNIGMRIETGDEFVQFRLIDGKYPNWPAVIPKENPFQVTVKREPLIKILDSLSKVWNKTTYQVAIDLVKNKITAGDLDLGTESTMELPVQHKNITQPEPYKDKEGKLVVPDKLEWFSIGFNGKFLIDILKTFEDEEITLYMSAPNRAALFNKQSLLMPIMLNS